MLLHPEPTLPYTNNENDNPPKNKHKRRKKPHNFGRSSRVDCVIMKENMEIGQTNPKKLLFIYCVWYILYESAGQCCEKSITNKIVLTIIH